MLQNPSKLQRVELQRQKFVMEIGVALHTYGTPTHRLEVALYQLVARFEMEAQILATPTSITVAFGPMENQQVAMRRVEPCEINLGKLVQVDDLVNDTLQRKLTLQQSIDGVRAIELLPTRFSARWLAPAGMAASGSIAAFFHASTTEIIVASVLGTLVAIVMAKGSRQPELARLIEPLAAVMAAVSVVCLACIWPLNINLVLIASVILLVPGFSLTLAIRELATRHLVAGSARMFGAALVFLQLGFGVILAQKLAKVLPVLPPPPPVVGPFDWGELAALVTSALAFGIFFQVRGRDFGWVLLASSLAFTGSRAGGIAFGPESGGFMGALLLGLAANGFARRTGRPASLLLVPGTILLVPGTIGLKSMTALVGQDVLGGVQAGFGALMIATSIVAGLLIADFALPPKRSL